jgi:predicted ATP-grasp superfamily ATP-dependent carboligase
MILEGNSRTTLGVVRSLGRRGIPIFLGSSERLPKSGVSRYVTRRFAYPSGEAGDAAMHEAIMRHVQAWRPAVLMPAGGDEEWSTIYRHEAEYAAVTRIVPTPSWHQFSRLEQDKEYLYQLAIEHGVAIPATFVTRTLEEALALRDGLPYPVVVKPRRGAAGMGVLKVDEARALSALLNPGEVPPLIQECLDGEEIELTILCAHGEPLAASVYQTLRHFPIPYGPPTACVTVRDDRLIGETIRFMRRLAYHGVAHMDFIRDRRDGVAKLIDFNPALTGTNDISLASGVDFAWKLYRLALGERVEPGFACEEGVEYRWLLYGEFLHLLGTPHKLHTLRTMWPRRRVRTNVSLSDPLPHLTEGITMTRRHVARWWTGRKQERRPRLGAAEPT